LPVLLVMGFTMPGRAWRFIVPELAATRDVCTFDNRGAGASTATEGPYTMAQLAGDAVRLLDHLGWQRAHVVGVSMGGMIAQRLALNATSRLASLTLIATHAGGLLSIMPPVRGVLPFVQANFLAKSGSPERRYRALARMLFPRPWLDSTDAARVEELLRHDFEPPAPEVGRKGQLKAVFGHRAARELGRLQGLPTLIIKPTEDALIAPRHSDRLHRAIPNSRLVVFEGAGHGLIRQVPGELAQVIGEHLSRADD
jgi:3-oxoadipate enol-lactonase